MNGWSHGTNHPTSATYDTAFTVNNPTKAGYTFSGWKIIWMDSVTHTIWTGTTTATGIARTKETDFKNLNSTSGAIVTFEALWTANTNTQYIVYHYVKRAWTGTYELSELEIWYWTTDTVLTLSWLASTGFTCAHYDSWSLTWSESWPWEIVTWAKINGDGTTKIYLYYVRDYYRVTLSGDAHVDALKINGVEREEAYLECGSDVPVEAVPKPWYHFVRWREE